MATFIIQVWGDPDRPELFFAWTGNVVDRSRATQFTTRERAESTHALCGTYADRGWTSKVVEVKS